ncbi:hypothetical protein BT93_E2069 [Corymbia citriodora subsp. variegata]|nr:hypothetical protein BT93_E2069 [Corymbia citriodora subsp. variegata]
MDHKDDHDSNLRVISVVGKQACGKTALVRSVFSRHEIKHHFDCRAWVHVACGHGAEPDLMKNLLVDILKQVPPRDQTKDLEHKKEEELSEMLHISLMEHRYLIVLDNLHKASLINELLVPFVDSMNGSRVVVTTPNALVQKFADPWTLNLRLLPRLTRKERKRLLRRSITGNDDSGSEMTDLEQRILSSCSSPPAISMLGGLLSAVEKSNWAALINQLGEHPTLDDVMHLSFDELPYMMKPCVLYMALFPRESEVPTRRLFRLWAAEGLVQMQSAEDCFWELESRNLIRVVKRKPDGRARSYRMPAFIHKFFCWKAEELRLLQVQCSPDCVCDSDEQSPHCPQKQAQNTVTGHYGRKVRCLQSFALFDTRKLETQAKEIGALLKSPILDKCLVLLRVLDLEGVYKPVLPKTFGNKLPNLRYLGLRWTALDLIPESVGNLFFLETLDLKHTDITKLSSSIWNAKNLRHLYLSEASIDKSSHHQISSGKYLNTKLETLWGLFIETADSPMLHVLEQLQSLKKLGVTCRPRAAEKVRECASKLKGLESLRLRSRDLFGQAASLDLSNTTGAESLSKLYLLGSLRPVQDLSSILRENLKVLTLSMSELKEDPMPDLGRLKDLTILRLLARSYTGEDLLIKKEGFQNLRVLKLWMLENLGTFKVEEGGMVELEELEIRQCQMLRSVAGLYPIDSLKSVRLRGVGVSSVEVPQRTLVKPKKLGCICHAVNYKKSSRGPSTSSLN